MKNPSYRFDDLTEEEASVIVSSLFRELHLVEGTKLYKSNLIRGIIEKVTVTEDAHRRNRRME